MEVTTPATSCAGCGATLTGGAIEGFCARCFALAAFEVRLADETRPAPHPLARLGNYELLEEIGRGGMGVVYRARQVGLNREVAVKVLRAGPLALSEHAERFRREAGAAAAFHHPNVVAVHEVGEADGHIFFSMELVPGRTLADLTREGPLEPSRAARYLRAIAGAIAAAHAAGILHRDLKPSNVLVDPADQPRVTDFGLAKRLDNAEATQSGQVLGSPAYMPPEQADPALGQLTFASDVYSLGALLYHLLTGRPPFAAASMAATLAQVLHEDLVPPRRLNSNIPRDLETLCLKCLQREPRRRYASARHLADDLQALLDHRPIQARPVTAPERALLWCRRRPALAGLLLALHLVGGVGLAGIFWQWHTNRLNLYAADLRVASESLHVHDYGRARALLATHAPRRPGDADFTWRYLQRRAAGDGGRILGEHPWIVNAVAWSPDGRWLASGSVGSGTVGDDVRIWDLSHSERPALVLSPRGARALAWFPDNQRLLSTHHDGVTRIWNVADRRAIAEFAGRSAQLSADGRWLATCEGNPYPWAHEGPTNGPVTVRDLPKGTAFRLPEARSIALSPDGEWLARGDLEHTIWIHHRASGAVVRQLAAEGPWWSLTFSPDARVLVAAGTNPDLRIWRLDETNATPRRAHGHERDTWQVGFSADGRRMASAGSDQTVRLWEVDTLAPLGVLHGHGGEVWCVAFSPDGASLASGGKDRSVRLWPAFPPSDFATIPGNPYAPVAFSPHAAAVATFARPGETNATLQPLNASIPAVLLEQGQLVGFVGQHPLPAIARGFDLHGLAAPANSARSVTLEHEPGEETPTLWTTAPQAGAVGACSPSGRLSIWNAASGQRLAALDLDPPLAWRLALSRNGQWAAVTAGEHGFWLCSIPDRRARRLTAHADQAKDAAFSADDRLLATASVDATVKLWDVRRATVVATLRGHPTEVTSVAFAPDGTTLASGEYGQGLRLWHLPTLRETAVIPLAETGDWIGFAPDGRTLAVRLKGGGIRLLPAP